MASSRRPLWIKTGRGNSGSGAGETEGGEGKKGTGNGEIMEAEDGEPVSPAARLFLQPRFNCHIVSVMGCGKRIDVDAIKAGLEVTLVRHPRFSSIQVTSSPQTSLSSPFFSPFALFFLRRWVTVEAPQIN